LRIKSAKITQKNRANNIESGPEEEINSSRDLTIRHHQIKAHCFVRLIVFLAVEVYLTTELLAKRVFRKGVHDLELNCSF